MSELAKQKATVLAGLSLFMAGTVLGIALRPDIPSMEPVINSYTELQTQVNAMATACARPQEGIVTVTGQDLIDAVRKKPVTWKVQTQVKRRGGQAVTPAHVVPVAETK